MRTTFTTIALPLLLCCGCAATFNPGPPGTIGMQRERAVIHDPFPIDELGPPIMGGRPREFDLPLSEAKNLQVSPFARRGARAPALPFVGF